MNALEENYEARFSNYASPALNYVYTYNGNGQLESRELVASDTLAATELVREYDSAGNMRLGYERQLDEYRDEVYGTSHRSLYGRDQKLRFYLQYGRQVPDVGEPDHANDLKQEFRYDALGRRVLVRNLHRPLCDPQERDCTHAIERYVWDGDQILWELRAPGDTSDNLEVQYTTGREYGLVAYVHGRGIDVPLGIARSAYSPGGSFLLVPHLDWRGQWELGTDEEGERYPACGADPNCVRIGWPSTAVRSYLEKLGAEGEGDWVGSLLRDQRDPSGFLYRRNRYYDPMAGRFTQPDPIGLAGGINLYGFAGGDPANFADPFGLDGILVQYLFYKVSVWVGGRKIRLPVGHAAVIAVDKSGYTRYYEYGRYPGFGSFGGVNREPIPNLEMGADGRPTAESLEHLYEFISEEYGQGKHVHALYFADADYQAIVDYAEGVMNDENRKAYSLFSNTCFTFALKAIQAGLKHEDSDEDRDLNLLHKEIK